MSMFALSDPCLFWQPSSPETETSQRPRPAKGKADYRDERQSSNDSAIKRFMFLQAAAFLHLRLIRAWKYPPARFSCGRNPLRRDFLNEMRLPSPGEQALRLPRPWPAFPVSLL